MKKFSSKILVMLFIFGFIVFIFPKVSAVKNQYDTNRRVDKYFDLVQEIPRKQLKNEIKKAEDYNKTLVGSLVPDVFIEHEKEGNAEYETLLNPIENAVMGTVEIPAIHVHLPIYHYASEESMALGAGHLPGSSLPVGGHSTHSVIIAHRGKPELEYFKDLDQLEFGSTFSIHIMGSTLYYEVDRISVVDPSEVSSLAIKEGQDYCTLITCTPYGVNTHRLLVRGHRI